MILVVGATGTNGREVVKQLSARGVPVRALVRSAEKSPDLRLPNVELVRGDLGDPPSLDAALRGVDRAFIVTAVDQRCVEWFRNFFDAA
ncbi:MAG TPA: NAD(P)H-binding protein, partial [Gemmataceae bacterium]|nr:NAD(P)H-binding protein [Gemmataceae bacterium]